MIEVFADIVCPFTHASLRHLDAYRRDHAPTLRFRVRSWPLELVNGQPVDPSMLAAEIDAIRAGVAAQLFGGFDADRFPRTTLPALAAEAAAYREGDEVGERFSLAIRDALWERGLDVSDPAVIAEVAHLAGAPKAGSADDEAVRRSWAEGRTRGVAGSPHFFTPSGDFFCPSLDIEHHGGDYDVRFDREGFERFIAAAVA
jgi:predicted DsbA family dithiol-disulfide isomerase